MLTLGMFDLKSRMVRDSCWTAMLNHNRALGFVFFICSSSNSASAYSSSRSFLYALAVTGRFIFSLCCVNVLAYSVSLAWRKRVLKWREALT